MQSAILRQRDSITHPDPELAADIASRRVYCTIARRITHDPKSESRER